MNRQVAGRIKHGERAEVELTGYGLGLPHETELVEKVGEDEWLLGMEQDELLQLVGKAGAIWILRDALGKFGNSNNSLMPVEMALPCPFCGSSNVGNKYIETYSTDSSYDTFGCKDCGARFEDGCQDDWNRRAAPAVQVEPVAMVDADDDGMWADILPNVTVKVGQILYTAPQPVEQTFEWPDADAINQMAFEEGQPAENGDGYLFSAEEFDLFVERLLSSVEATPSHTFPQSAEQQPDVAQMVEALERIASLPIDSCSTENDYRLSGAKAIAAGVLADRRSQGGE